MNHNIRGRVNYDGWVTISASLLIASSVDRALGPRNHKTRNITGNRAASRRSISTGWPVLRWIKKAFKILNFKIKKRIEVNYEYPEWSIDNDFSEGHQEREKERLFCFLNEQHNPAQRAGEQRESEAGRWIGGAAHTTSVSDIHRSNHWVDATGG